MENLEKYKVGVLKKTKAFAFDRDGTLEWGNPPGPVKREHLIELRRLGYDIGGSGSQLPEEQYANWRNHGIEPDFAVFKSDLRTLSTRYESITHVGDDISDKEISRNAGFDYFTPYEFVLWIRRKIAKIYRKRRI